MTPGRPDCFEIRESRATRLVKILSLLTVAMMAVHLVRPLNLPGLRRRADFWKIAAIALAAIGLTVLVRPGSL
jgi:hypothetical protein